MAIILENKTNASPPNAVYPYGNISNDSGAADGTPVDVRVYADFHQFFARLIDLSGVTINDLPDNVTNDFQYYEALLATPSNLAVTNEANIEINRKKINQTLGLLCGDFSSF